MKETVTGRKKGGVRERKGEKRSEWRRGRERR